MHAPSSNTSKGTSKGKGKARTTQGTKGKGKTKYNDRQGYKGKGQKGKGNGGRRNTTGYATPATTDQELSEAETYPDTTPSVQEWEPDQEVDVSALQQELNEMHRRQSMPLWCTKQFNQGCDGTCGRPHIAYEDAQAMLQYRRETNARSSVRVHPPTAKSKQSSEEESY